MSELINVVVLGGAGVGKSCLTVQFVQGHFVSNYDPTVEDSYRKTVTIDDNSYVSEILDTAGTEQFPGLRAVYMKKGEGFLLVYSVIAAVTFKDLDSIVQAIEAQKKSSKFCAVVVGNKIDLEDERQVSHAEGQEFAKNVGGGAEYFEASAKTNTNVTEAFTALVRRVLKSRNEAESDGGEKPKKRFCAVL